MFAPTTFGKYYLTERLAVGGMAEIYRGKLLGPGGFEKQLVIKQILPRYATRRDFVDMFVAEAKTTVSLSHGNIVPIFELGVVDGTYFIAMEYVDGPTLYELIKAARARGRRLGPAIAAWVVAETLKGLDYAHRKGVGVIHRDLSPRNVIVSRDGEVKILDFGLAATLETAAEKSAASSGGGRPVGSYPYMSPEQARREPLDPRSDLFSAGILLWESLTGEALFGRPDDDETLAAVIGAAIAAPSTRAPEVPEALDAVCLRALARDRDRRFRAAAEFQAALGRWLYTVDPPVTPAALAALVSELCPDVPAGSAAPPAFDVEGETTAPHDDGLSTRPMPQTPTVERSFATSVELERALERNRTPLMPFRALEAAERAAAPPPATPAPAPAPAPRRRWKLAAVAAIAVVAAAAVVLRGNDDTRPPPLATTAADAAPAPPPPPDAAPAPADAAVVDASAPDAPPRVPPTRRTGRLIVGTTTASWVAVYVDGKKVGNTPLDAVVAAGPHRVRVECAPVVCPPDGRKDSFDVVVPAGGEVRRKIGW